MHLTVTIANHSYAVEVLEFTGHVQNEPRTCWIVTAVDVAGYYQVNPVPGPDDLLNTLVGGFLCGGPTGCALCAAGVQQAAVTPPSFSTIQNELAQGRLVVFAPNAHASAIYACADGGSSNSQYIVYHDPTRGQSVSLHSDWTSGSTRFWLTAPPGPFQLPPVTSQSIDNVTGGIQSVARLPSGQAYDLFVISSASQISGHALLGGPVAQRFPNPRDLEWADVPFHQQKTSRGALLTPEQAADLTSHLSLDVAASAFIDVPPAGVRALWRRDADEVFILLPRPIALGGLDQAGPYRFQDFLDRVQEALRAVAVVCPPINIPDGCKGCNLDP
jgi:hypothetical protein